MLRFTFQKCVLLWEEEAPSAARHQRHKLQQPEPVVDSSPPALAVVDPDGEEAEEEEEAGHPEAHLVDGLVPHQLVTVLPGVQLLAHVAVERHLTDEKKERKKRAKELNQITAVR